MGSQRCPGVPWDDFDMENPNLQPEMQKSELQRRKFRDENFKNYLFNRITGLVVALPLLLLSLRPSRGPPNRYQDHQDHAS